MDFGLRTCDRELNLGPRTAELGLGTADRGPLSSDRGPQSSDLGQTYKTHIHKARGVSGPQTLSRAELLNYITEIPRVCVIACIRETILADMFLLPVPAGSSNPAEAEAWPHPVRCMSSEIS